MPDGAKGGPASKPSDRPKASASVPRKKPAAEASASVSAPSPEKRAAEPTDGSVTARLYPSPDREKSLRLPAPQPPKPAEPEQPEGDTRIQKEGGPQIPIVLNAQVRWFIRYFTGPHRRTFTKWLERSGRYEKMIRRILREEGLPEDLVYVALIESGFNPKAFSGAGASGIWQFMRSTARKYGLVVNWWIDERRDPVKATKAAARYFKDLHGAFRSWYLAQAGYNAGEGRIRRGLRRLKRKDFWTLARTRYIGRETRNFVPKYVAAAIIAKNPRAYGFTTLRYEAPIRYEEVPIRRPTDLRWIAAAAGVSLQELQRLNPELRRWRTPPNYPGYRVKVPPGTSQKVARAAESWTPKRFGGQERYRVQRGDTLGMIAQNLGSTVEAIAEFNALSDPGRIYVGQVLLIPTRPEKRTRRASPAAASREEGGPAGKRPIHVVRSGDTLWEISLRYGVRLKDLLAWNRLPRDARIRPGDTIRLSPDKP